MHDIPVSNGDLPDLPAIEVSRQWA